MGLQDLVVIVDENDQPIGTDTIENARKQGSIHRIARVMVENPKGQILLQKRSAKLTWPHCWDNSAAGHVDEGEDHLQAAKRELFEEIGVSADNLEEIGKYFTDVTNQYGTLKRFNSVYKLVIDYTPTKLQPSEVAKVKWFDVDEAKQLIQEQPEKVTDGLVDVINRYYS